MPHPPTRVLYKTFPVSNYDMLVSSMFISFRRHMPLAFNYDSTNEDDNWFYGICHYDDVIGQPLGHGRGWAESLVMEQFEINDKRYAEMEREREKKQRLREEKERQEEEEEERQRELAERAGK